MAFRIVKENGYINTIDQLDKIAADLWNKEIDKKYFATPFNKPDEKMTIQEEMNFFMRNANWYDIIGRAIHESKAKNWEEVKNRILEPFLEANITEEQVKDQSFFGPYFDLINKFESLELKPQYHAD